MKVGKRILAGASAMATFLVVAASPVMAQSYYSDYYSAYDSPASTAGVLGFGLLWCCFAIIPLVIGLVLAYVVYKDAQKNKVENPILWGIITFFFNIIGLLIYFLAIKPEAVKKNEVEAIAKPEVKKE